jgi:hypothetical protein
MSMLFGKRLLLVVVPSMVATTVVGVFLGRMARASSLPGQAAGYTQCPYMPFVSGSPFMMSIQNSLYDANSQISYATVSDPSGNLLGYWSVNNQSTAQCMINGNSVYVITAVFNTTLLTNPPNGANEKPSVKNIAVTRSPTTGSTLCLKTNVMGDGCPTNPTPIAISPVNPCP